MKSTRQKRDELRHLVRKARAIVREGATKRNYSVRRDMRSWCGDWSYVFKQLAKKKGIKAKIIDGEVDRRQHFWVQASGFLCDGTGAQFGKLPHTQVRKKSNVSDRYEEVCSNVEDTCGWLSEKEWDEEIKVY